MTAHVHAQDVLVVEDDHATAELERRALVRAGIKTHVVGRVGDALALMERQPFGAILLDYQLPDGDPWAIVDAAGAQTPRIPVVIVTGMGNERIAAEALHRGAADYVKKKDTFWDELPATVDRVTRLAQAEAALVRSERKARAILDAMPDLMFRMTREGVFLDYQAHSANELYAPPEQIVGGDIRKLMPPAFAQETLRHIHNALETGTMQRWEYQLPMPRGPEDFEARMVPSGPDDVLAIVRNITSIKEAQRVVQASLREKDVLLKEIHHRVKNNLQVISSLLNLQEQHVRDPLARAMFAESRGRVQSIALVHGRLHRAEDRSQVNFAEYVPTLVEGLLHGHNAEGRVESRLDLGDVSLPVDAAVPCGLIINELVTNSLKHAFPGKRGGSIRVEMSRGRPDQVELTVEDDGIGLPVNLDPRRSTTLGMDLVFTLADQLHAKVDVQRDRGTRFRFRFREEARRAASH